MKRHNVLLLNASSIYAGGEFYVLILADELRRKGHSVTVSCRPDNLLAAKCRERGIDVVPVGFPEKGGLRKHVGRLKGLIREKGADIVHSNTNYDRTAGAIAARLTGAKHVANIHSFHSISHNLTHWLRNRYWTDRFVTVGDCVKEILVREDGIPAPKISTVHLGLDPEETRASPDLRARVRAEFGLAPGTLLLSNVGRLVPFKGQEYLLRSFASVAGKFPDVTLLLAGDGELERFLRDLAEKLQIAGRVIFAGFRDDMPAVYSATDVYVHSSVEGGGETFPFAILQALAYGLPMTVTDVGEVSAMARNGENAFVVRDRDEEAFAAALSKLLEDGDLRRMMGERSRAFLLEKFTAEKMAGRIAGIYDDVTS